MVRVRWAVMFLFFMEIIVMIIAVTILRWVSLSKVNRENSKREKKMTIVFSVILVICICILFIIACLLYQVSQQQLVERLDKTQIELESLIGKDVLDQKYVSKVEDYNKEVDIYYTYVLASQGYKDKSLFLHLLGPFNTVVFCDFEKDYKKFEVQNIRFDIVEKEW